MITRTQGNAFEIIVPLYTRTLHEDGTIDIAEYTPQDDDVIIVTLAGCRNYRYNAEGGDKCCIFKMTGAEVAGTYALEVVIIQADGKRLRYAAKEALQLTNETSEDDAQGAEFTASGVTLDAAWFFFAKGDKGDNGAPGKDGKDGKDGTGIASISKVGSVGLVDTYRILYTDGGITTFEVTNGKQGANGRGIANIAKTSSEGLVDTYTITYTDGTTSTYTVTNGKDGKGEEVDAYTKAEADSRFAKVNDATQTIKAQGVSVSDVVLKGGSLNTDDDGNLRYDGDKVLVEGDAVPLTRKVNNKPLSTDVTLSASDINVMVYKKHSVDEITTPLQSLLLGYNNQWQPILQSGENIKTINGETLLGEGDIEIQGGGSKEVHIGTDAPTEGEVLWIDPTEEVIVQTTGTATDKVMSQKAVTEAISNIPMPSGGDWELIADLNITEAVHQISQDLGGDYQEVLIVGNPTPEAITSGASGNSWKFSPTNSIYNTMSINSMAVARNAYIHCFIRGGFIYCLSHCQLTQNSGQNPVLSGTSTTLTSLKNIGFFVDNAGMGVKGHLQIFGKK